MGNPNNEFLEKAAVLGLAVPAGVMGGSMIKDALDKPSLSQQIKNELNADSDKRAEERRIADREEAARRKKAPSGGGSGESKAVPKTYKKGGMVSSASKRADGCAVKGKTKGRMV